MSTNDYCSACGKWNCFGECVDDEVSYFERRRQKFSLPVVHELTGEPISEEVSTRIERPGGPTGRRPERWHKIDQWWYEFENFCITKGPNEMALMRSNHGSRLIEDADRVTFWITPKRSGEDACGMLCHITALIHADGGFENWEIRGVALVNGTGDLGAARKFTGFYDHQKRLGYISFK